MNTVQNRCRREGAEAEVAINGGESRRLLRISMKPQMLRADEARFGFSVQDSCTENLYGVGGLGTHDGLGVGLMAPPAIVGSILVYIMATKGLIYYVAYATSLR